MLSFLRKDVLVLIRDRTELLVLLLMPIILTVILGFALKGMFSGEFTGLDMEVAVVNQNNAEAGIEQFQQEVGQLSVPQQAKEELLKASETVEPYRMLEEMLQSEQVSEVINVHSMDEAEAKQALKAEEIVAILKVSEDFTYQSLAKMLLDQGGGSELQVIEGEDAAISAGVFHDIIQRFVRTLNLETAIAKAAEQTEVTAAGETDVQPSQLGGRLTVTDEEPISSIEYYTIGMAVMFSLFVASTIASKAYLENFEHVLDRILLSGKHPLLYLSGKAISTAVIVFLQVAILFVMARFLLQAFADNSLQFWLGMLVIALFFSICIGALGALLTAITLKSESNIVPSVFSAGIVSVLAFLGGSFSPVSQMPDIFATLGNWTPNGIMLTATLQWSQGLGQEFITPLVLRLLLLTATLSIISLLIFSKRRAA
ncbi:ABC transporter permease [Sediminibacillus albus]|uniref:ABC-2 type transport system permease protein n=1 Tax=Sediminibacillus albus TaxID=407036 RepID=A0A1G8WLK9_9BACI|nr:ABC transporter permease [Sediminibacillus albus]SDJ78933.1 ABC-2 type transport system permease protein [Sediminibacillus albus]